ncbi:MAG: glycosyl hydrolase 115 family protein, partial [Bacteroidales bacterium]|nr:glycosyl hydrolase 115 family protein [Bacteroidales bacterium]
MRKLFLSSVFALIMVLPAFSQLATENKLFISTDPVKGSFAIFQDGKVSPLLVSSADWPGVVRAFKDLSSDLGKVTGITPQVLFDKPFRTGELIIAGTIGKSPLIDRLVKRKKINVSDVAGKWESYLIQVVKHPLPGVKRALVIAGSDKRGTIYGIYEVSKQAGVSPWYWWADVPVTEKQALYALNGRHVFGSPSVKYRGIFLNDEAPDLTNWVRA